MGKLVKRLAILGSTGSIGQQTLAVVRALPHRFQVVGLAAGKNVGLLAKQITEFRPRLVSCQGRLPSSALGGRDYQLVSPEEIAAHPDVDMVVVATAGMAGLSPTLAAIGAGKPVALANKEALVMAGETITDEAKLRGTQILPIDSEHSAIWQCLKGEAQPAARLILTASGGPFRGYSPAELDRVSVEQALAHPSWQMGRKVTIDSATLMNKGLEVIEAHWLFDIDIDKIMVLIHPQSIIHSMVEFDDGTVKAQLSYPDMRLPIQYALSYPEHLPNPELPRLDWSRSRELTFAPPDFDTFPCLRLAIAAGKKGGTGPAVLCAADEIAVELFLAGRIKFTEIARLVERVLTEHKATAHPTLGEIMAADAWARQKAREIATGEQC